MPEDICQYCINLDDMEKDFPGEVHEGAQLICGECGAEYYLPWGQSYMSVNEPAKVNHPELKVL